MYNFIGFQQCLEILEWGCEVDLVCPPQKRSAAQIDKCWHLIRSRIVKDTHSQEGSKYDGTGGTRSYPFQPNSKMVDLQSKIQKVQLGNYMTQLQLWPSQRFLRQVSSLSLTGMTPSSPPAGYKIRSTVVAVPEFWCEASKWAGVSWMVLHVVDWCLAYILGLVLYWGWCWRYHDWDMWGWWVVGQRVFTRCQ